MDNDALFGRFAAHPAIIAVLTEILSDNVKVWFDHLFNKPPFNSTPPYFGANRYHQDGFFHLSKRSVTCWIALDELTEQNGCLRFVPLTAGYGQFRFDKLGYRITEKHLEQEVRVTLQPGDADGETLASVVRTLLPGGHGAQNMEGLFDLSSFTGSLEVTSTEPIVALSLNNEADPVFSSLPPGEVDAAAQ